MKIKLLIVSLTAFFTATSVQTNAQTWTPVGAGTDNIIYCLQTDTANNLLYAGGYFTIAGGSSAANIAKWNGTSWDSLGAGINGQIKAMAIYNGELYAGGHFTLAGGTSANNIAKWNGSIWTSVGAGLNISGYVESLVANDSILYVGGYSITTAGGIPVSNIAKWNGINWSNLGTGITPIGGDVAALEIYGNEVYAAGGFTGAGGVSVSNIAKWNGTNWSSVGTGITGEVLVLKVYNSKLYAGGVFSIAGGIPAPYIANWNGAIWDSVGGGIDFYVDALTVYDSSLYAGGLFWNAGGVPVNNIAQWNGIAWNSVGGGIPNFSGNTTPIVKDLAVFNSSLYAAGNFNTLTGGPSNYIAKWNSATVNINEKLIVNVLNVFPNPFSTQTILQTSIMLKDATLTVYNTYGQQVKQIKNISGQTVTLNRDNLSSGLYFLRLSQADKTFSTDKLVITDN